MGRVADARKRARKTASRGEARHPAGPVRGRGAAAPPEPPADEPSLVFPAEPSDRRGARIALPASGLAEDILAMAEAADVPAEPMASVAPALPVPAAPAPGGRAARAQHLLLRLSRARGAQGGGGHGAPGHLLPVPRGVRRGRAARPGDHPRLRDHAGAARAGVHQGRDQPARAHHPRGGPEAEARAGRGGARAAGPHRGGQDPRPPRRAARGRRLPGAEGTRSPSSRRRPRRWWRSTPTTSAEWPSCPSA